MYYGVSLTVGGMGIQEVIASIYWYTAEMGEIGV